MTNSEARKRMQASSGPESPLSRPQTANLGDGANGLSEADIACGCGHAVAWHHDTRGCAYRGFSPGHRCPCLLLPDDVVRSIVREHTERAWDEGMAFGQQHWATNYGINGRVAPNPYRAARQEQNR